MTAAIEIDRATRRLRTNGDTAVWMAPKPAGGVVPVLRFSTPDGRRYAVALSRDELVNVHETAFAILAASDATVEEWLDQAADAVLRQA